MVAASAAALAHTSAVLFQQNDWCQFSWCFNTRAMPLGNICPILHTFYQIFKYKTCQILLPFRPGYMQLFPSIIVRWLSVLDKKCTNQVLNNVTWHIFTCGGISHLPDLKRNTSGQVSCTALVVNYHTRLQFWTN